MAFECRTVHSAQVRWWWSFTQHEFAMRAQVRNFFSTQFICCGWYWLLFCLNLRLNRVQRTQNRWWWAWDATQTNKHVSNSNHMKTTKHTHTHTTFTRQLKIRTSKRFRLADRRWVKRFRTIWMVRMRTCQCVCGWCHAANDCVEPNQV